MKVLLGLLLLALLALGLVLLTTSGSTTGDTNTEIAEQAVSHKQPAPEVLDAGGEPPEVVRKTIAAPAGLEDPEKVAAVEAVAPTEKPKTGFVSGRIVDDQGAPVNNARVVLAPEGFTGKLQGWENARKGTFSLPIPHAGRFVIGASARDKGMLVSEAHELSPEAAHEIGDILFPPGERIRGVVRYPDGGPAEKVWLQAVREGHQASRFGSAHRLADLRAGSHSDNTHSEEDGSFVLEGLVEGRYVINSQSRMFLQDGVKVSSITARTGSELEMTLVGYRVHLALAGLPENSRSEQVVLQRYELPWPESGAWNGLLPPKEAFEGIEPRPSYVWGRGRDLWFQEPCFVRVHGKTPNEWESEVIFAVEPEVYRSEATLTFEAPPDFETGTLLVNALGADGKPVSWARIHRVKDGDATSHYFNEIGNAGEPIQGLPVGNHRFRVSPGFMGFEEQMNHADAYFDAEILAGRTTERDVRLPVGGKLELTVYGAAPDESLDARIEFTLVSGEGGTLLWFMQEGAIGRMLSPNVPIDGDPYESSLARPGLYRLTLIANDFLPYEQTVEIVAGETVKLDIGLVRE